MQDTQCGILYIPDRMSSICVRKMRNKLKKERNENNNE